MSHISSLFFPVAILALTAAVHGMKGCQSDATFQLTFNYMWSEMYNFTDVPRSAHFSPLIAFSHSNRYPTFIPYGTASDGFMSVAETGGTFALKNELETAKAAGQVKDIQIDDAVPDGDGTATVVLSVNCTFRYVSAVSMVAPSPDWVVPLFRADILRMTKKSNATDMNKAKMMYKYRKMVKGSITVWDAGTDSGMELTSPNMPSNPRENIAPLMDAPFHDMPIANYTLMKMKKNEMMIMN